MTSYIKILKFFNFHFHSSNFSKLLSSHSTPLGWAFCKGAPGFKNQKKFELSVE
jgi:hypothetical protein